MLGITSYMAGDVPGGVRYYTQAVPLFREIGDLQGLVNSLSTLAMRGSSFMSKSVRWRDCRYGRSRPRWR